MTSRHLVDPELLPLLELFPNTPVSADNLYELRAMEAPPMPVEDCGVDVEDRSIDGPGGKLNLRVYRPREATEALGCIFHIHGGGFLFGSAKNMEHEHRPLAASQQCVITSVDYRVAPETCFPGNIEDCYAALAWVVANAGTLGVDTGRIGVMGESAGGGLAAALALLARDRGEHGLAFQHLIYPMLDDRTCVGDAHPLTGEFVWAPESNRFGWASLLGHEPGLEGVSPYAAPARAEDLTGLPPTFISTGALDLFLEEDIEYARRLTRAGVPTELHVWPGAFHAFDAMPQAQVASAARLASGNALSRFLARRDSAG